MVVPVWIWVAAAVLAVVVAAEIVLTGRSARKSPGGSSRVRQAVLWVGVYVTLAVLFGLALGLASGWTQAGQFYAGFLTEYSLSLDNLFIFYVIMSWLAVPAARQQRVLLYGIILALVLRTVLIVAGTAAVNRFDWLFYPLGGFLLWTAFGLLRGRADSPAEEQPGRVLRYVQGRLTRAGAGGEGSGGAAGHHVVPPMVLLIGAIAVADVLFAFDSIPAIFGITTKPVLIVAANVFALMGLRHLYVLLVRMLDRLVYLNTGLAVVCAFIGAKLILQALHDNGVQWAVHIPTWLSIVVVVLVLAVTAIAGWAGQAAERRRQRLAAVVDGPMSMGALPGGPLSSSERLRLERRFEVIDTDGNGAWQRADCALLTQRLCAAFGHTADSAPGQAVATGQLGLFDVLLRHMDTDHNQEISRDEFITGLGTSITDRPAFDIAVHTAALTLVQVADRDRNGVLDSAEYADLAAVYGADADEAAAAFDRLDLDRNGVLDTAELTVAISQFFASRPVADEDRILRPVG
ncbi:MAG TPA: TerC/Alx family metal homeostasis membrane protein [Streptosporangiaceae bacterium]|jgi:tellurite resistance protein TerC